MQIFIVLFSLRPQYAPRGSLVRIFPVVRYQEKNNKTNLKIGEVTYNSPKKYVKSWLALMALTIYKLSIFLSLIVLPLAAHAKIADFDEYLQKKAADSYEQSLNSFNPNPEGLTDDFNQLVGK